MAAPRCCTTAVRATSARSRASCAWRAKPSGARDLPQHVLTRRDRAAEIPSSRLADSDRLPAGGEAGWGWGAVPAAQSEKMLPRVEELSGRRLLDLAHRRPTCLRAREMRNFCCRGRRHAHRYRYLHGQRTHHQGGRLRTAPPSQFGRSLRSIQKAEMEVIRRLRASTRVR